MKTSTITVTLDEARIWYNSDNDSLKELALRTFSEKELKTVHYTEIKDFNDAIKALNYNSHDIQKIYSTIDAISNYSKASAAMFKLNIIRRALNKDYDLHLTTDIEKNACVWCPNINFVVSGYIFPDDLEENIKIGTFVSENVKYDAYFTDIETDACGGVGSFMQCYGISYSHPNIGFFGCATKEIAKHFGEYFGMLILEAMYGDIVNFNIIEQ